jgi:hypothetical protein
MPHTPGPYQLVILDAPLSDWTGARFVIRSKKHAPGGVAVIIGGTGAEEEAATARLFQNAPGMLAALRMAREELVFGGDWATAKKIVDAAIADATAEVEP